MVTEKSAKRRGKRARLSAKQPSMADVAREAGVSMITVSRMRRLPALVADETRERIEQAIERLGYVPNLVAGGLAATQTRIVAAIVPDIQHGVFADAIQGLSDTLRAHDYSVLLGTSGGSAEEEARIIRTLFGNRPAALVLHGANHTPEARLLMQRANIPIVEIGTIPREPIDIYVGYSNWTAAHAITTRLLTLGRCRIGIVTADPAKNDRSAERLAGYKAALEDAGIAFDPDLTLVREYGMAEGGDALTTLLARAPDMDALFCVSDLWAAGAIFECQRRSIAVPERVAICGFNDQEIAGEIYPGITTIRVRRREIGELAGAAIVARLRNEPSNVAIDVGYELVVRESG